MKSAIFLLTLLAVTICFENECQSQENRMEAPRIAVKWSTLHLIYFYPSVQLAVEHKLFQNVNLQYDLGWVFDNRLYNSESYVDKSGFRGIAELRYYIPSPPKIPFYIAGEFYYSRINFDRNNIIGYECISGDCSYFEYVTYKVQNQNQGLGLKYGLLLYPGWNRNRSIFIDINVGCAYRSIKYNEIGKPIALNGDFFENDYYDELLFLPNEDDRREFRPILGVRVGYSFH